MRATRAPGPLNPDVRRLGSCTGDADRASQSHREREDSPTPKCREKRRVTASSAAPRPVHVHRATRGKWRDHQAEPGRSRAGRTNGFGNTQQVMKPAADPTMHRPMPASIGFAERPRRSECASDAKPSSKSTSVNSCRRISASSWSRSSRMAASMPPQESVCAERLGAERPALAPSAGRNALTPGRSSGLLGVSGRIPLTAFPEDPPSECDRTYESHRIETS
jgi:hypothetical protein